MKKVSLLFILSLAVILLIVPVAFAQDNYTTGMQVQNLADTDAIIQIKFYNPNGTVDATVDDTVAANGSNTYFPVGASDGFEGSVVISSDQPVAAIANVLRGSQGSSYGGFSGGSEVVSLPLINKANYGIDTWFNVQNTGSASTDVTVSYSGQPTCDETKTIPMGAAETFDQAANTCLPAGYVGAASVTAASGGTVVATVMQVADNGLFAYNGFTSGAEFPVMPLVSANWYGFHTGMQIQNTGVASTDVTVAYTPAPGAGNGTACTETKTIAGGASETFTLYAFSLAGTTSSTCTHGADFNGSAAVTVNSDGSDLVAIINQTDFNLKGSAYNGFDPASATDTVVMPLIQDSYGYWTGYNVVNVGTSAEVTCSYSDADASYDVTETVASNEALNVVQVNGVSGGSLPGNVQSGTGYTGGATCVAAAGGELLGVVNQAAYTDTGSDSTLTYEAFNN